MEIVLLPKAFSFLAYSFPGLASGTLLLFCRGTLQVKLGHGEEGPGRGVVVGLTKAI